MAQTSPCAGLEYILALSASRADSVFRELCQRFGSPAVVDEHCVRLQLEGCQCILSRTEGGNAVIVLQAEPPARGKASHSWAEDLAECKQQLAPLKEAASHGLLASFTVLLAYPRGDETAEALLEQCSSLWRAEPAAPAS